MCNFRSLRPDEVEIRVAQCKKNDKGRVWAQYLIYKDARVDQRILDETVGSLYWKKSYEILDGRLYCTVSVYNKELKEWIGKQDVGTESDTEPEKGQASDAFKRACTCLGIGRELYSSPKIFIWLEKGEYDERNGKVYPKSGLFTVAEMTVENEKISSLVIIDKNNTIRFGWPAPSRPDNPRDQRAEQSVSRPVIPQNPTAPPKPKPTDGQLQKMAARIRRGEDIYGDIDRAFAMTRDEWTRLDQYVKQTNTQ